MRHVYIHVPFCARRCSYCDFAIAVRRQIPGRDFVRAIEAERRARAADGERWDAPWDTAYLGGGTPSMLSGEDVIRLLAEFAPAPGAEVTLEANPDDVSPRIAGSWVSAGITRVSLGTQSFQDSALRWMHRTHTAEATARAVRILRDVGIAEISLDLIFGLPAGVERDWPKDLDLALALEPDHVSVYGLTVEPRTPLARWIARGVSPSPPDDGFRDEFLLAHRVLTSSGFRHYEISNYARDGGQPREARHNTAYWNGEPYVGLGPSAHGFDGTVRRWNLRQWVAYHTTVAAGTDPIEGRETLSLEQRRLERVYLGLRTLEGIPADTVKADSTAVITAIEHGWLVQREGRLRPTVDGWLVLDELVPRLTTSGEGG